MGIWSALDCDLALLCLAILLCRQEGACRCSLLTGRLSGNATRRIIETAQLLVDVMSKGGLTDPDGRARRTIQKVRLMHAAVRHLTELHPTWKPEFGLPVNQEDLAGTLMAFSWISLDGLRRVGIALTDDEWSAYLHCWQIVGHQLGLRDDMIPADTASAEALCAAIARRQFASCPEGILMTEALVQSIQYQLPGNLFDAAPALLIRYFLGDEYAAMIGVQKTLLGQTGLRGLLALPLEAGGEALSDLAHDSQAIASVAEQMGKLLINSILLVERGGNRPTFTIPKELQQQWGVNWTS